MASLRFYPTLTAGLVLGFLAALPAGASPSSATSTATQLAPAAELQYSIKARQSGIPLSGSATVRWQHDEHSYRILTETRASLFGKILDANSEGSLDEYGLAPDKFTEKRFGKPATVSHFDRSARQISFTASEARYPIKGGEQDRTSAVWQLIAQARANSLRFKAGSEWNMFVAGRRDAEPWNFKVLGSESLNTPLGELQAWHISKAPPPDSKGQQLDIWLAPALEWYPVRLKFTDADGEYVDQILDSVQPAH